MSNVKQQNFDKDDPENAPKDVNWRYRVGAWLIKIHRYSLFELFKKSVQASRYWLIEQSKYIKPKYVKLSLAMIIGLSVLGLFIAPLFDTKMMLVKNQDENAIPIIPPTPQPIQEVALIKTLAPPEPLYHRHEITIENGMTLDQALAGVGIEPRQRYFIATVMQEEYDPRRLLVGQKMVAQIDESGILNDLQIVIAPDEYLWVKRNEEGGFVSEWERHPPIIKRVHKAGVIDSSLYMAASQAGVPDNIIIEMIRLYAFDVDFQREIRKGDRFEVFYDAYYSSKGDYLRQADIQMASLMIQGTDYRYYRFEENDGEYAFFDEEGKTAQKGLLRTPVDGARLSSHYGMRKHPILGYNRMHKGTDFAAPTGTPIYAAGDGTITFAGVNGGYGNFVRIAHPNGYETAYAHLHRFGKGIRKGVRVKQYQIIGLVGTTGRSTGPHLHYEITINGEHVNPMKVRMPTSRQLAGDELNRFLNQRQQIIAELNRFLKAQSDMIAEN